MQSAKARPGRGLDGPGPARSRGVVLGRARRRSSSLCLWYPGAGLAATHPPPLQEWCAAGSWISWTRIRALEARHGRDVLYYALYSAHKGVPVQRQIFSHGTFSATRWLHILNGRVVPNRMSYAAQDTKDRISSCQTSRIRASAHRGPGARLPMGAAMGDLQIADNIHTLQEHVRSSAREPL